ncbi:S8 family peptidase [Pseudoalteromonas luteoviolacea]|uniref:S8 family peptidase n=1 Tax=Pseudoalteromonas luteoviolacea TaxID=43657 RepID=UPI00041EB119|nr:S8/S53 family peptidase [Pseudoalteromonas luteoviolacea]
MSFKNYGRDVALFTSETANIYTSNIGQEFYLNHKIIIQVEKGYKDKFTHLTGVFQTQLLSELSNSDIVLISPKKGQFLTVYKRLENISSVEAVQPDYAIVKKHHRTSKARKGVNIHFKPPNRLQNSQCEVSISPTRIAIIDDGFDFSSTALSPFNVLLEYDADRQEVMIADTTRVAGHGTMVASVIASQLNSKPISKMSHVAEVVAIQQASTLNSAMILAFSVAQKMNADIVNSSWTLPFVSQLLASVIDDGLLHGDVSFVIVSAGNHAQDACISNKLSVIEGVTTIGALSKDGSIAPFSNYGNCVDYYAPSTALLQKQNKRIAVSGTSSAAAMATGEFSYLLSCGLSNNDIEIKNNKLK